MKKPGLDVMIALKPKPPAMKNGPGFPALKQPDGHAEDPSGMGDDEESEEADTATCLKRIEGKLDAIISGLRDLGATIPDVAEDKSEDGSQTGDEEQG